MIETSFRLELKDENAIREFIQKEVYEPFLLNLLLETPYFSKKTERISNQSNSECDYYDPENGKYYEATLLANNRILSKVIADPAYLASEQLMNEWEDILQIFSKRLSSKEHKNASIILFNIFPDIFAKFQGSITDTYLYDNADHIVNNLVNKNERLNSKDIILVSFNWDGNFFYRTLNSYKGDLVFINNYSKSIFPFTIINPEVKIINK